MTKDLAGNATSRMANIVELRQQGLSLSAIGRRLGITHQTVAQALRQQRG